MLMSGVTASSRLTLRSLVCCVVAAVLVLLGTAQLSAAQTPQGDGEPVTLVLALGSSLSDVGTAASLVAAGEGRAVVFASSAAALGDTAVGVVAETQPAKVVIVGGTAAVAASVQAELGLAAPGVSIERLAGTDRVHTAALAARRTLAATSGASVIIANGWSLPDVGAAAAAVAAGAADAVLYAHRDGLGEPTREVLDRHRPARVLIAGGTAALSAQVQQQAGQAAGGAPTSRLGGATRTHTAALLASTALESGADTAVIANGWSLPEVGAAAALAASLDDSYVVYAQSADSLGDPARAALVGHPPARAYLIGDTDTLTTALHQQLRQAVPNATIITITDRSHTTHHALDITPPATPGPDQSAPATDVVEYRAGDAIPGFPSGFAAASGNFSGASVSVTDGGTTVTVTIGRNGSAAYADATYTCTTAGGCTIVNGRVAAGTVNATTTAATTTAASAPDLVVDTPTVSDSSPAAGARFTLSATVRNQGNGPSAFTTLRYYRSADTTITTGDTPAGTDSVSGLGAQESGAESVSLTAPSTPGTYYYGACVGSASGESDTTNNCSAAVTITAETDTTAAETTLEILGDCRDGMVLHAGEGCRYQGTATAGATRPNVVLSVDDGGAICREGGPVKIFFVTVDSFRKCDSNGFERDDTFGSNITVQRTAGQSWTVRRSSSATPDNANGDCYVGLVVAQGERCTYPGSANDFSVDVSGRGHFIFFTAGTGINARGTTINGVTYNFAASKQPDGTWIIEAAG